MDAAVIANALRTISTEADPTLKSAKMASLCSALFHERGIKLVVVGGSAIELLTEGDYTSGDLDLCYDTPGSITQRDRQEIMGLLLGGDGGPRNWQVAGMYVDLLGPVESFARTPYRLLEGPFGQICVMKAEDLLVERVLVATYPYPNETARACARMPAVLILTWDWDE